MAHFDPKAIGFRPTWAEINLKNLAYNFRQIKSFLAPGIKVMVCVKADAYGHGLVPVAQRLASCGVDYLSVASIDEGIRLRESGIKKPILVLGMILQEDARPLLKYNLSQTVCTLELAAALDTIARKIKDTRDAAFVEKDQDGNVVNRTEAVANLGGSALDNEECYLLSKLNRALGVVYLEHHARI